MESEKMSFTISPSFVDSINGERTFQKEMVDFSKNNENILIVNAPTGAGKTHAFHNMDGLGGVIIVLPTNLLAERVYEDLNSKDKSAIILTKSKVDSAMNSEYETRKVGKLSAIKEMITFKKFIVTNPTVLLYLILNYYGHRENESIRKNESDMAVFLRKQGFSTIIFDEFHVYSQDQTRIVLSINIILKDLFKFVYSSATPTKMVKKAIYKMAGEFDLKVNEINVPRLTKGTGKPVQGTLEVEIHTGNGYSVSEYVKDNLNKFKKNYWLLIVDRITQIEAIYKELVKAGVPYNEMSMLDGYHRKGGFGKRIVIASNLVEQGINIDPYYRKIVIDAGHDIKNLMQRVGRVGRGSVEKSSVYICLPKEMHLDTKCEIETYDEFIDYIKPILPERTVVVSLYSIGVFMAALMLRFSGNLQFEIGNKFPEGSEVHSGFRDFNYVDKKISPEAEWVKEHSGEFPELNKIKNWWLDYRKTFYNFIENVKEVEVTDTSLGPDQQFEAKYNFYWILSNKNLTEITKDTFVASATRNIPDLSFEVSVSGIPFIRTDSYSYSEILYNARSVIIDALDTELHFSSLTGINKEIGILLSKIKLIVLSTAGKGRLEIVDYRPLHV